MASLAKHFSFLSLLLISLFLSSHARVVHVNFNKVPNKNGLQGTLTPEIKAPTLPKNEGYPYSLYGSVQDQKTPGTYAADQVRFEKSNKFPSSYNEFAYVTNADSKNAPPTPPEEVTTPNGDHTNSQFDFSIPHPQNPSNSNTFEYDEAMYELQNAKEEEKAEKRKDDEAVKEYFRNRNKNYNNKDNVNMFYKETDQRTYDSSYEEKMNPYRYQDQRQVESMSNARVIPEKQQGLSDTRFLENGKYYYNLGNHNTENYPYANSQSFAKSEQSSNAFYNGFYNQQVNPEDVSIP